MGSTQEPQATPDELHKLEEDIVQREGDDRRDEGPVREPDVNDDREKLERRGIIAPTPD